MSEKEIPERGHQMTADRENHGGSGLGASSCSPLPADHPLTLHPLNAENLNRIKSDVRDGKATPYLETYALCRYLMLEQKCEFCHEAPLSQSEREYMEKHFKENAQAMASADEKTTPKETTL